MRTLCVVGLALAGLSVVHAQEKGPLSVGITAGKTDVGSDTLWLGLETSNTLLAAHVSYRPLPYLAAEASIGKLQEGGDTIAGARAPVDGRILQASVLPMLPVTAWFSMFARLAWVDWSLYGERTAGSVAESVSIDGADFMWGLGAEFYNDGPVMFRMEYQRADIENVRLSTLSGTLSYSF